MNNLPALLGNNPTFKDKVPFTKPTLPDFQVFVEGLRPIFESGILTKGEHVARLEEMIADELDVRYAIAVSNCTSGLMLVYRALNLSGEVIVPSFTFIATVSALVWLGLKPIFVDVDPHTGTLDAASVEAVITPATSAIVAVHNFGNPAEVDELERIAGRHNLRLIFDAAHAFGSMYRGRFLSAQGDAHVFSLSPTKLVVAGEGGVVTTNDQLLAETVRIGREYGNCGNYNSTFVGLNARMPEINALLAQQSLQGLAPAVKYRNEIAGAYRDGLKNLPGIEFQRIRPNDRSAYTMFTITIDADAFGLTRNELREALSAENVDTRCYYDPPVHRQSAYMHFANRDEDLRHTDLLSATSLCLPMSSNLPRPVVDGICQAIERAHRHAPEIKVRLAADLLALA